MLAAITTMLAAAIIGNGRGVAAQPESTDENANVFTAVFGSGSASLAVGSGNTFTVKLGGAELLQGTTPSLFFNGEWLQVGHGLRGAGHAPSSGIHPVHGAYAAYSFTYRYTDDVAGIDRRYITSYTHYTEGDYLAFAQEFPDGADNVNTTAPYPGVLSGDILRRASKGSPASVRNRAVMFSKDSLLRDSFNSSTVPSATFPRVSSWGFPSRSFGVMTWQDTFSTAVYSNEVQPAGAIGGPIVMWNRSAATPFTPCAVWAPADNLKDNIIGSVPVEGNSTLAAAGPQGYLLSIPSGAVFTSLLVVHSGGVTAGVHRWGDVHASWNPPLRSSEAGRRGGAGRSPKGVSWRGGGVLKEKDTMSTSISYWTDNGAFYDYYHWYNPLADGTPQKVLTEVWTSFAKEGVPLDYLQLDAYWFPNEPVDCSCKVNDTELANLFPDGLQALSMQTGPLLLYSGPTCDSSTYWKKNGGEWDSIQSVYFDQGWAKGRLGNIRPELSAEFYKSVMVRSRDRQGMRDFEIDFLSFNTLMFPGMMEQVGSAELWLEGMATAAANAGINIQYCMAMPSDLLLSAKYPNVVNARASPDYIPGWDGNFRVGGTALLLSALGLGASKDNFWTSHVQNDTASGRAGNEPNNELIAMIAVMGRGPFGPSDQLGKTNFSVIRPAMRADGVLRQPSRPLAPLERTYFDGLSHAGLVSYGTHTEVAGVFFYTVLLTDPPLQPVVTVLEDLYPPPPSPASNVTADYVMLRWNSGCANLSAIGDCVVPLDTPLQVAAPNVSIPGVHYDYPPAEYQLFSVAEVRNGTALLGEIDSYVAVSESRFRHVSVDATRGCVDITVVGTPGETVRIAFVIQTKYVLRVETFVSSLMNIHSGP
eukprot:TRINITY_DN12730_c2_g1_i1.p1 TRINITY_DN12730_c2_g1~~TRINITY_DN12730_c2_g1_i1.p1  ORF type:complete len:871 (+),score=296.29 TRINITY_DN12730_c2_g1_i1:77-2689(+)